MERVRAYYRTLHRMAELSAKEYETAAFLERELKAMGYQPRRISKTGVVADLVSDESLPWILLRADTDALPIEEKSGVPFASEHAGVMHACGHDAHTAMLLTAASQLIGKRLKNNIRFLFQPAEELVGGADVMVELGVLDVAPVACFAIHVWPQMEAGRLAVGQMASSDTIVIRVLGSSAHCARCEEGTNALLTASEIALTLEAMRKEEPNAVIFIGQLQSGTAHNIVADRAEMTGSLRTYTEADGARLKKRIEEAAALAGERYGTSVEVIWDGSSPATKNDPALSKALSALFGETLIDAPASYTGEDFAYYQQFAPGIMLWMGIGDTPQLHTDTFIMPEDLLETGVAAWERIANHIWV